MVDNLKFELDTDCYLYDNKREHFKKYGYLYSWEAANKSLPA